MQSVEPVWYQKAPESTREVPPIPVVGDLPESTGVSAVPVKESGGTGEEECLQQGRTGDRMEV